MHQTLRAGRGTHGNRARAPASTTLAQAQHGLITTEQAVEALGPSRKARWVVRATPALRPAVGVPDGRGAGDLAPGVHGRRAGGGGVVSHRSAAELWGLIHPAGYVEMSHRPPTQAAPSSAGDRPPHPRSAPGARRRARPGCSSPIRCARSSTSGWCCRAGRCSDALSRGIYRPACLTIVRREGAARGAGPAGSQRHGRRPRADPGASACSPSARRRASSRSGLLTSLGGTTCRRSCSSTRSGTPAASSLGSTRRYPELKLAIEVDGFEHHSSPDGVPAGPHTPEPPRRARVDGAALHLGRTS